MTGAGRLGARRRPVSTAEPPHRLLLILGGWTAWLRALVSTTTKRRRDSGLARSRCWTPRPNTETSSSGPSRYWRPAAAASCSGPGSLWARAGSDRVALARAAAKLAPPRLRDPSGYRLPASLRRLGGRLPRRHLLRRHCVSPPRSALRRFWMPSRSMHPWMDLSVSRVTR